MDADGLPIIGLGIDYAKVEALQTKRTLAFMNHFIAQTVSFLNQFSCVCEERLEALTTRMQRLETMMSILETKLASIPGLENVTLPSSTSAVTSSNTALSTGENTTVSTSANITSPAIVEQSSTVNIERNMQSLSEEPTSQGIPASTPAIDPRYAKYFQRMKVGVPLMSLRPELLLEGLDPAVLENPGQAAVIASAAAAPPTNIATANQSTASEATANQNRADEASNSQSDLSDLSEQSSSDEERSFDSDV